ncbi:hypothetical protein [Pseudoalteromonas luteoviolacea]|nr:hypothetical protein [Pseudoalteromonas luteoviolacea]MBQ4880289.1 hypothetical protein [Pseudoalteromonas luteoviolacea]MBQ4909330.1 hypothetical protein [Pseudoalteromonas luteoviolacea]
MAKTFALPLCQEYFKQVPHVEKVDVGTNDNELLSVYGFSLDESQLITIKKLKESLSNSLNIKSQFGGVNEISIVCTSENAVGFTIKGKLGELSAFYLFKKGSYYAGPLLYTEGDVLTIKSDSF